MKHRGVRALIGFLGLVVGLLCIDFYERNRAVGAPSGWTHVAGQVVAEASGTPHIGTSAWRMAAGTVWSSQRPADQMYVRASLDENAVMSMSLAADGGSGLWFSVGPGETLQAFVGTEVASCMGKIDGLSGVPSIELERGTDGVTIRVQDQRKWKGDEEETSLDPGALWGR